MSMTKPEQRIAIAVWMGWHTQRIGDGVDYWTTPEGHFGVNQLNQSLAPPNYPDDLNAMHEAEKKLDENQLCDYTNMVLYDVVADVTNADNLCAKKHAKVICATSQQRSEAFCRTLWPERFE